MDQGQLDALYQQYLGRGVDPSGAATWGNADYNTVVQGILGSQEYQNRQQGSQPAPQQSAPQQSGGGTDINSIYQQYLGRNVDPSGAATYAGWNSQDIVNAILGSQEYAQRRNSNDGVSPSAPASGNPQELANQVFGAYKTNANYDQALNQLNALPQNADYYRARLGLLGNMMGWQTGQNTGDRNVVYQRELESYLPGARAAGLSDAEINALINKNSAAASQENQNRIAQEAAQGQGWVNQNIPGGWGTVAGLAALAAVPYFAPEILGAGAAAEGAGAAGSGSWGLSPSLAAELGLEGSTTGLSGLGASGDVLAGLGLEGAAGSGSWGLSPELAAELGLDYSTSGLTDLSGEAGSALLESMGLNTGMALPAWMTASTLANVAKGGSALASLAKTLGLTGSGSTGATTTGTTGVNPNALANALKGLSGTGTGTGSQLGTNFNLVKGNVNPFSYGKEIPVQAQVANKADPFAALNVAQTPVQPINPLAHLFG